MANLGCKEQWTKKFIELPRLLRAIINLNGPLKGYFF